MSQPPGKIKEVFMDTALTELDDIRSDLSRSIGVLLVLADGLDGYTRSMHFADTHTDAFVNAMFLAYDALDAIIGEFGEALERARGERETNG